MGEQPKLASELRQRRRETCQACHGLTDKTWQQGNPNAPRRCFGKAQHGVDLVHDAVLSTAVLEPPPRARDSGLIDEADPIVMWHVDRRVDGVQLVLGAVNGPGNLTDA